MILTDLNRAIGRLEAVAEDHARRFDHLGKKMEGLETALNALLPKLDQAARHASDWEATKKRGLIALAAAGGLGMLSLFGLQKLAPVIMAVLPK